ncbi:methyltransferase domain-containing protein [Paraburkholderia fungorum]|uniref:methyltransferase domain-containing protein n=1 Tax=Paraburkholderia fungorum TaxID=134537 RepID=UPI0038B6E6BA
MSAQISGTEGYADEAAALLRNWREIPFAELHRSILHLIPRGPARILDIGSGAGGDAAALAESGHTVVAVEPTDALRVPAMAMHTSSRIEWLDDSLPDLTVLCARKGTYDVVMLTAVWMHLDAHQRARSMPRVASLMCEGGVLIMSLRHGPVPPGRRMFEVSAQETIDLAALYELRPVLNLGTPSIQEGNRRSGVNWTRLAFEKPGADQSIGAARD